MMPRERNLVLGEYDIGEWRYKELKAFCRQYPEKKATAAALLGINASSRVQSYTNAKGQQEGIVLPGSKGAVSDPVAAAAEKRERLLHDVHMIDRCAGAVNGGEYAQALILNICYARPFDTIPQELLPNSYRNKYFEARRRFFCLLDAEKNGSDQDDEKN